AGGVEPERRVVRGAAAQGEPVARVTEVVVGDDAERAGVQAHPRGEGVGGAQLDGAGTAEGQAGEEVVRAGAADDAGERERARVVGADAVRTGADLDRVGQRRRPGAGVGHA